MQDGNITLSEAVLATLPSASLALDDDGRIAWLSNSLCQLLGVESGELQGKSVDEVEQVALKELLQQHAEVAVESPTGGLRQLSLVSSGKVGEWSLIHYQDACREAALKAKVEALEQTLEAKAGQHPVTGLLNRQTVLQNLNSEVSRSRRYHNPLTVVLMQLSNVDELLAQSGNDNESPIMRSLSFLLRDQMRWADIIGHFSDTQLLLVLPETDASDASGLLEKLSERIKGLHFSGAEQLSCEPQASFGVAQWQRGDDMTMLVKRAEASLFESLSHNAA